VLCNGAPQTRLSQAADAFRSPRRRRRPKRVVGDRSAFDASTAQGAGSRVTASAGALAHARRSLRCLKVRITPRAAEACPDKSLGRVFSRLATRWSELAQLGCSSRRVQFPLGGRTCDWRRPDCHNGARDPRSSTCGAGEVLHASCIEIRGSTFGAVSDICSF
jgi:hypothetical protein